MKFKKKKLNIIDELSHIEVGKSASPTNQEKLSGEASETDQDWFDIFRDAQSDKKSKRV